MLNLCSISVMIMWNVEWALMMMRTVLYRYSSTWNMLPTTIRHSFKKSLKPQLPQFSFMAVLEPFYLFGTVYFVFDSIRIPLFIALCVESFRLFSDLNFRLILNFIVSRIICRFKLMSFYCFSVKPWKTNSHFVEANGDPNFQRHYVTKTLLLMFNLVSGYWFWYYHLRNQLVFETCSLSLDVC